MCTPLINIIIIDSRIRLDAGAEVRSKYPVPTLLKNA